MIPPAFKSFARYACVGALNTSVHWALFLVLVHKAHQPQAPANLMAFLVAVSFSYFANAKWTFGVAASGKRYLYYVGFMGLVAASLGEVAQLLALPPLLTLCLFSAVSLVLGFAYARGVIFKEQAHTC